MFGINWDDTDDGKPNREFMTNTVKAVFTLLTDLAVPGVDKETAEHMFEMMLKAERAEAIREAAQAWGADPDGENWVGDNDKDYRNNLITYADRLEADESEGA